MNKNREEKTDYTMTILEIVTGLTSLNVKSLKPLSTYEKHLASQLDPETISHILIVKNKKIVKGIE